MSGSDESRTPDAPPANGGETAREQQRQARLRVQRERFGEVARRLEADESSERFEVALGTLLPPKRIRREPE